jgi:hypothetical protein
VGRRRNELGLGLIVLVNVCDDWERLFLYWIVCVYLCIWLVSGMGWKEGYVYRTYLPTYLEAYRCNAE